MVAGERAERVPGDLRVVMAMIVDKARRDDLAAGIDGLAGGAGQFADLGDLAVLDRDIAVERRHPRAVDDPAVLDQQVIRHLCPSRSRSVAVAINYSTWRRPVVGDCAPPGLCAPHESPHRSVVQDGAYRPIDLIEVVSCVYYLCRERTIAVLTE